MSTADERRPPRPHRRAPQVRWPAMPIAAKLGGLLAVLVVQLVVVAGTMFGQLQQVQRGYDALLSGQVQEGLQARKMQVEFKKQVQEWKNILLRGSDPADLATYTQQFRDQSATVTRLNTELLGTVSDPATRQELALFRGEHEALNTAYEVALAPFVAAGARDPSAADDAVRGQDRPPTDRVDGIVDRLDASIVEATATQKADLAARQQLLLVVGGLLLVAVLAVVTLVVLGIIRPVRRLTRDADRAAHETLPAAVAHIQTMPADAAAPPVPELRVDTRDELEELGRALSRMQSSAVDLAVQQHRAERESAEMLINLGRRNQNLLGRTISYITALEAAERNPEVLAQLFRLDHATTRIRRGAESMLVLASATQTRTWSRPVPIADIAQAALSEVEEYQRVDLYHVEDVAVVGTAVADLVHLIAELVENATHFSPPDVRVTILGQYLSDDQYRLRVVDQGIGMTSRELDDANDRIRRAASGGRTDTQLLGLHVVGRLAHRRGIAVTLEPSAGRGITANCLLPPSLIVDVQSIDEQSDAQLPDATASEQRSYGTPDTAAIRQRLGALQRGVHAARSEHGGSIPPGRSRPVTGANEPGSDCDTDPSDVAPSTEGRRP